MKSENNRKINEYIQNQIKESKNIAEDTMRKKDLENMIKESITAIKDKHRCSEQAKKKAVNNFLKKQEQIMTAEVIRKIKNLKKTEAAIRNRISNDQTAAGIIQNNREILEKKISDPNEAKNPADTSYSKDLVKTEMNPNDLAYIKNYNNLEIDLIDFAYKKMSKYNVRLGNSEADDLESISEVIPTPSKDQRITDNVAKALKSGNVNMSKNNVGLENSDTDDLEIISAESLRCAAGAGELLGATSWFLAS